MVFVNLQTIQTGACSSNVGIFSGQNIQDSWDSHSPTIVSFGFVMGDYCVSTSGLSLLWTDSVNGQAIFDNDVKQNQAQSQTR